MQNSSIDFLFEKLNVIYPNSKNNSLFESHIGPQIIDLLFFKPKKILSAKVLNKLEELEHENTVIIKIRVIKHHQNYFNRKVPYKISVLFNRKKISLIFFSKYTGYLKKIYPLEKDLFIKGKLDFYNNNLQITHPEKIDEKIIFNKKSLHQVVYKQKKHLRVKQFILLY